MNTMFQWHLMSSQYCGIIISVYFPKLFITHNNNNTLYSLSSHSLVSLSPWPPPTHFLHWWIYLFWILPVNGIIQYMDDFCAWLLSLSMFFSFDSSCLFQLRRREQRADHCLTMTQHLLPMPHTSPSTLFLLFPLACPALFQDPEGDP